MQLKKIAVIISIVIIVLVAGTYFEFQSSDTVLHHTDFKNCDIQEGDFLRCTENAIYLETPEPAQTASGKWNTEVSLPPAKLSWKWNGQDWESYNLWVKVTFSDQRTI